VPEAVESPDLADTADLRAQLDQAIDRLPDRYRLPLVLHYLEGLTVPEVARRLGCPEGTASARLARGRERLRSRLSRSALPLPAQPEALAQLISNPAVSPSSGLLALIQGVIRSMSTTRLTIAVVLTLAAGVLGIGVVSVPAPGGSEPSVSAAAPPVASVSTRAKPRSKLPPLQTPSAEAESSLPQPEWPADRESDLLRRCLRRWEKEADQARALAVQLRRIDRTRNPDSSTAFIGTARLLGPDLGVLELRREGKQQPFQKVLRTATTLYEYVPASKEVRRRVLPAGKAWPADMAWQPLTLFRARMKEIERTVALRVVKEDQWYVYLELEPRPRAAELLWSRGRLVLSKGNGLPRQLWLEFPGREVTWDFARVKVGGPIDRKEFEPRVPAGWKMIAVR
jgi:hypothetical protein